MKQKRLVVVSYDALVYEDLAHLNRFPCFGELWNKGSRINKVRTIYPSLTYPSHVSILTGALAGKHGIVNNEPSEPGNLHCDWYWFHEPVRVPDLHDVAKAAGLTTASVFWPVTGADPSIDYLIAEYWAQGKNDTLEAAYKRAGTSDQLFEEVVRPVLSKLDSWESPLTDEGKIICACEIIKRHQPHLLTLHLGQVDYYRHRYGIFNDKVTQGVLQSERFLQMLMEACREAGVYDETNFVVVSDHGQINYTRTMNLNMLLREEGLIRTDEEGNFLDWDAWIKAANFSAQVYLKRPEDEALKERVYKILKKYCSDGDKGISRVYTAQEAREEEGLYGDFSFVIESDDTTLFTANWRDPLFTPAKILQEGYLRASHGHHPTKGPQPVFLAMGPQVRGGVVRETGRIIDEAPTMARMLGLDLPDTDGEVMWDFLSEADEGKL